MSWTTGVLFLVGARRGFFFATTSSPPLGPTQPPIQWLLVTLFLGGKVAGAWSWPLTSIYCRSQECVELCLHSPPTSSWHCT